MQTSDNIITKGSALGNPIVIEHIRFAPDILRRLGEELNPHPDQGILELVRNAYDADANNCDIILDGVDKPGGSILVVDDGVGMNSSSIRNGWLLIGRSSKAATKRTKRGRLPVGDKGLGRLAALRLGTVAEVLTRPASNPGSAFRLSIDWEVIDQAFMVEEVPLEVQEERTTERPGTIIQVKGLRTALTENDVKRLSRALLLMADPFGGRTSFNPRLRAAAYGAYEKLIEEAYFEYAELKLEAHLDSEGWSHARVLGQHGRLLYDSGSEPINKQAYTAPPAQFELWEFKLSAADFIRRPIGISDIRDWLSVFGGVHLYHRGMRVPPYGDPGHDWLNLNLARASSPEQRPSTNNSIGRVSVEDEDGTLLQKTDRSGFVEGPAFRDLRACFIEVLDWMARLRLKDRDERIRESKKKAAQDVERSKKALDQRVDLLPAEEKANLKAAVVEYFKATSNESDLYKTEVRLYRTLATVGTTAAVFAHESKRPLERIDEQLNDAINALRTPNLFREDLMLEMLELMQEDLRSVGNYATLALRLTQRRKRDAGVLNLCEEVNEVTTSFQPYFQSIRAELRICIPQEPIKVYSDSSSIEAIVANLLSNARYFVAKGKGPKIVEVEVSASEKEAIIRVSDSGPGIVGIEMDDIWIAGETTRDKGRGTGLGLKIVKDTVAELGGTATARAHGSLDGAEFLIVLPVYGAPR